MIFFALETHDHAVHLQSYLANLSKMKEMGVGVIAIEGDYDIVMSQGDANSSNRFLLSSFKEKSNQYARGMVALLVQNNCTLTQLVSDPLSVLNQCKKNDKNTLDMNKIIQFYHSKVLVDVVTQALRMQFLVRGMDPYSGTPDHKRREEGMAKSIYDLHQEDPNRHVFVMLGVAHGASVLAHLKGLGCKDVYACRTISEKSFSANITYKRDLTDLSVFDYPVFNFSTLQGEKEFYQTMRQYFARRLTTSLTWSQFATHQQPYGPYRDAFCCSASASEVVSALQTGKFTEHEITQMICGIPLRDLTEEFVQTVISDHAKESWIRALVHNPLGFDLNKVNKVMHMSNVVPILSAFIDRCMHSESEITQMICHAPTRALTQKFIELVTFKSQNKSYIEALTLNGRKEVSLSKSRVIDEMLMTPALVRSKLEDPKSCSNYDIAEMIKRIPCSRLTERFVNFIISDHAFPVLIIALTCNPFGRDKEKCRKVQSMALGSSQSGHNLFQPEPADANTKAAASGIKAAAGTGY